MTAHSIYSASAAGRWVNCVGSIALAHGAPKGSSAAAREGTAGHALGEQCLRNNQEPLDFEGEVFEVEGQDIPVTDDLAHAVQKYVDYVRGISGVKLYEVRVYYARMLGVPDDEAFGTADCIIVDGTTMHVIDLKLGRRYVDPAKNKQLMLYAAGEADVLESLGETIENIVLHIVQPRVTAAPQTYAMTRGELAEVVQEFEQAVSRAEQAQLLFQPSWAADGFSSTDALNWIDLYLLDGEAQCQWCPAASYCPRLRATVDDFIPSAPEEFDMVSALQLTDGAVIADALNKAPLLKIWIDAVEHEGFRRLSNRDKVPGYKLVTGREGNRKWTDPKAVETEFGDLGDAIHEKKLLSPAKLEKVLKKDPRASKIAALTHRNPARPTMASADDPRKEWVEAAGADEFDVVPTEPDGSLA